MHLSDCKVGMKVRFDRANGEKTLGEVIKMNPTKAKVRTLEERGRSSRTGRVGVIWNVPYSLMTPVYEGTTPHRPINSEKIEHLDVTVKEYRVHNHTPSGQLVVERNGVRHDLGYNCVHVLAVEIEELRAKIIDLENGSES